jgi:hypothetical protein
LAAALVARQYHKKFISPLLKKLKTALVFFFTAQTIIIFRTPHFYSIHHKVIALF